MHTRVTGIVLSDDDKILLLHQDTDGPRHRSLPGGKVEDGETLEEGLAREMREETGADVEAGRLLYLCNKRSGSRPAHHLRDSHHRRRPRRGHRERRHPADPRCRVRAAR
ncbi:NUDIX hydrolase [Streptomyces halstedii]|uniref:NUDIX hydrolase n=1 Tax=Streptomyces halstedii TaxID=1944 RepID=UPI0034607D1C